jgi:hypothetical protein
VPRPTDQKLLDRCAEAATDRKWTDHRDLRSFPRGKNAPEGKDYVKKASEESRNEVKLRAIEAALKGKDPDLKTAADAISEIKTGSVYLVDARNKFDVAKGPVVASTVADLKSFVRETDCKKYDGTIRTIRASTARISESPTGRPVHRIATPPAEDRVRVWRRHEVRRHAMRGDQDHPAAEPVRTPPHSTRSRRASGL